MQTFKQKINVDPDKYLIPKENNFINQMFFNWEEIKDIDYVDWASIHEIYDLIHEKFYYKYPSPFEMNYIFDNSAIAKNAMIFKDTKDNKNYDLTNVYNAMKSIIDCNSYVLFRISFNNRFYQLNNILVIIPKSEWIKLNSIQREHYLCINCYNNLILRKNKHIDWDNITKIPELKGETLHWVWFRKPKFKLSLIMIERMLSWIDNNPELSFNLWTDIENEVEFKEFIEDVKDKWPENKINIKYKKDIISFLQEYFAFYGNIKEIYDFNKNEFIRLINDRIYNKTLIAKTDYLRAMILHRLGGFYADFNDCECFLPMKYWFNEIGNKNFILPCDTMNEQNISNYFMWVPKGCSDFAKLHLSTLKGFDGILNCFINENTPKVISDLFLPQAKKLIRRMKQIETYKPVQLLGEIMYPFYNNIKFIETIKTSISEYALKGIQVNDIRPKVFFPMFCFKYLAQKYDNNIIKKFYNYMVNEFKLINNITRNANNINITYIDQNHQEDWDDIDEILYIYDDLIKYINDLENDTDFHIYIHDLFMKQMPSILMYMTNIIMHLPQQLSWDQLVPLCYVYYNMTYITMIGHYGDGTSTGIE